MKILSIDTSSKVCGVSILDDDTLLCNLDKLAENSHSESLMPLIDSALKQENLEIKDIDLLVCDVGPGSFTGIRIGVATVKGFCDTLNIPSVGINSLEALAYPICSLTSSNATTANLVCSILDCKNQNCYFALYQNSNNELLELIEPQAESLDCALSILDSYCKDNFDTYSITFVGDGSVNFKNEISSIFSDAIFVEEKFNLLNSYYLGLAGLNKYNTADTLPEVLPLYLKKPLAERQLEEKEKGANIKK